LANVPGDEQGILALVPDDWSVPWQRRHQVLTRLARHARVAWISPPLHWPEWLRSRRRPAGMQPAPASRMLVWSSARGVPTVRVSRAIHLAILRRRARLGAKWLRGHGCRSIELQIWFPEFADALGWDLHDSSSYHIDDEYSWATSERPMSAVERRLIERVDRVYVTSLRLQETKGGINPNTIFSPNGVDYRAFSTPATQPADLSRIPHPRIGYVGVLKEQLDWELLATLAQRHPSWSFVFVGPVRAGHTSIEPTLEVMRQWSNVHVLGERSVSQLPGYLQHMDVALLPYRRNAYTDAINPMKLYEALAAGIPVVASRLRSLEPFGGVIALAENPDQWTASITSALSDGSRSEARRAERQAAAKPYDWDAIAAALLPPGNEVKLA
jgi:glycosyltransferase involved in cell wall biosynthesis